MITSPVCNTFSMATPPLFPAHMPFLFHLGSASFYQVVLHPAWVLAPHAWPPPTPCAVFLIWPRLCHPKLGSTPQWMPSSHCSVSDCPPWASLCMVTLYFPNLCSNTLYQPTFQHGCPPCPIWLLTSPSCPSVNTLITLPGLCYSMHATPLPAWMPTLPCPIE